MSLSQLWVTEKLTEKGFVYFVSICRCCGKFVFGLNFSKPAWHFCPFVSDYDNQYETLKSKNQSGLNNVKPMLNLNHNMHLHLHFNLVVTEWLTNALDYLMEKC